MPACHKVNVICSLILQFQKNLGKALDADFFSIAFSADLVVLAEHALQRTARKEYRSRAFLPADAGLLPKVQRRTRKFYLVACLAKSGLSAAVHPAVSGTKAAKML